MLFFCSSTSRRVLGGEFGPLCLHHEDRFQQETARSAMPLASRGGRGRADPKVRLGKTGRRLPCGIYGRSRTSPSGPAPARAVWVVMIVRSWLGRFGNRPRTRPLAAWGVPPGVSTIAMM